MCSPTPTFEGLARGEIGVGLVGGENLPSVSVSQEATTVAYERTVSVLGSSPSWRRRRRCNPFDAWDGALPLERYDGSMITDDPQTCRAVSRRPPSLPSGLIHRDDAPGLRRRIRGLAPTLLGIGMILLVGCAQTNHYLIHPRKAAPEVIVWSADFARDELKVHIEGARPPGAGPFPTVLVLPEEERDGLGHARSDLGSRGARIRRDRR